MSGNGEQRAPGALDLAGVWRSLTTSLQEAADNLVHANPRLDSTLLQAEGLRFLTRMFSWGSLMEVENHDPAYPKLVKWMSPWLNIGYFCADGCYHYAPVHGDYAYRLYGSLGTARLFDVEVWEGDGADMESYHVIGGARDFMVGPKGEIEVLLSREPQDGNWVKLPDGLGCICARQYFYDWDTEEPAQLYIERIGASFPPPVDTDVALAERLELLLGCLKTATAQMRMAGELHYRTDPNVVEFHALEMQGSREHEDHLGLRGQYYARGRYHCELDQAIIMEVDEPESEYWSFQLLSHFWEPLDSWGVRKNSINGHQAVIDADGRFRAVIAHQDPGVPNWLDAAGHVRGLIGGRYLLPKSVPVPTLRTVPLDRVRDELPSATPTVTATGRSEELRRRVLSLRRRGCDEG